MAACLAAMTALEIGMESARRLDLRLKQLAELRVAPWLGAGFCLDIGSALIAKLGVPEPHTCAS
jgi:hypothetical protein